MDVSFCIVCTAQRELLLRGLDAIARERPALGLETEVLVLDNASGDGSREAAQEHATVDRVIALERRTGKAENDSTLMRAARGRYALLLNEDSELLPGAVRALYDALEARGWAAAAVATLLRPDGRAQPSAWRFPTPWTALAGALNLADRFVVQSTGDAVRAVDWAQSAALLVRTRAAAAVGYMDPAYFVYGEEVDFDRYLRDHEGPRAAALVRGFTALAYAERAAAALVLPRHDPRRYWRHVTATLWPQRGEGLREAADRRNADNR